MLILLQDVLSGLASLRKLNLLLDVKLWAQGRSFQVSPVIRALDVKLWVQCRSFLISHVYIALDVNLWA
jgi:hypothetical protein